MHRAVTAPRPTLIGGGQRGLSATSDYEPATRATPSCSKRITRQQVAEKLGITYATVANWRHFNPRREMVGRILTEYPDVSNFVGKPDPKPRFEVAVEVKIRNRTIIGPPIREVLRSRAVKAAKAMQVLAGSLEPWASDEFIWRRPKAEWPSEPGLFRAKLGLGTSPVVSIEDAFCRLGILVVGLPSTQGLPRSTLIMVQVGTKVIPVIVFIGEYASEAAKRFDLATEFGFLTCTSAHGRQQSWRTCGISRMNSWRR